MGQKAAIFARPSASDQCEKVVLATALGKYCEPKFHSRRQGFPRGDNFVMNIQAVHDGAVAATGLYSLWSFGEDDEVMGANSGDTRTSMLPAVLYVSGRWEHRKRYAAYRQDNNGSQNRLRISPESILGFSTIPYVFSRY